MSSALFDDILSHSRSLSGQMSPALDAIPEDSWTCPDCAQASKGLDRMESARLEKAKKKKKKKRSVVRSPTPSASTSAPASAAGACVAEEDDDDDDDAPLLFLPGPQKDPQKDQSEEKKRKRARPSPSSVSNCSNEGKKYRWNGYEFVKRPRENPKVGGWGNLALQDSDDEDACSGVKAADNEREREHRKAQEQMHEKSPRRAEPQHRLPQADQLQEVADTISDPESKVAAVTADVEQGLALERGELEDLGFQDLRPQMTEHVVSSNGATALRQAPPLPGDSGQDDEIEVVDEEGSFAADFPHSRHTCSKNPFDVRRDCFAACENCFCFVCEVKAQECQKWQVHCKASYNSQFWIAERDAARAARRAQLLGDSVAGGGGGSGSDSRPVGPEVGAGAAPLNVNVQLHAKQQEVVDKCLQGDNVFFTGMGGTGKSLVMKVLVAELKKKYGSESVVTCAPTGVSAIICGGQTLHSFAGCGVPSNVWEMGKIHYRHQGEQEVLHMLG